MQPDGNHHCIQVCRAGSPGTLRLRAPIAGAGKPGAGPEARACTRFIGVPCWLTTPGLPGPKPAVLADRRVPVGRPLPLPTPVLHVRQPNTRHRPALAGGRGRRPRRGSLCLWRALRLRCPPWLRRRPCGVWRACTAHPCRLRHDGRRCARSLGGPCGRRLAVHLLRVGQLPGAADLPQVPRASAGGGERSAGGGRRRAGTPRRQAALHPGATLQGDGLCLVGLASGFPALGPLRHALLADALRRWGWIVSCAALGI